MSEAKTFKYCVSVINEKMAEKDTITKGKIKQAGYFDFKDLYNFIYDLLSHNGYEINEKNYTEKVGGESKDIDIEWECFKKVSDYFKFQLKFSWKIVGMKAVEVQRGEKKIKTNQGALEIKFSAVLVKDYESRWEEAAFWKFLRGVYDRYVIRDRIEDYEERIIGDLSEVVGQVKSYLAVEGQ
jgi:hypothetical protein